MKTWIVKHGKPQSKLFTYHSCCIMWTLSSSGSAATNFIMLQNTHGLLLISTGNTFCQPEKPSCCILTSPEHFLTRYSDLTDCSVHFFDGREFLWNFVILVPGNWEDIYSEPSQSFSYLQFRAITLDKPVTAAEITPGERFFFKLLKPLHCTCKGHTASWEKKRKSKSER